MISVITAVHNQLAMNQLYWQHLKASTRAPFELIVIDNASTDGSGDFFASVGATVIRNTQNLSYPVTQNQGIAVARHDWLAFLNNDVIVSPGWDARLMASMEANGLDVATVCGIERVETRLATRHLRQRWNLMRALFKWSARTPDTLAKMHRWMYAWNGGWQAFSDQRAKQFAGQVFEGFVGNTVMMRRQALNKVGLWDETIQAGDFDLYLRTATRARDVGDIRPCHIVLDSFVHHFIRLTLDDKPTPFADRANLRPLEAKWPAADLAQLQALQALHQRT
jgi:GT2 family glycosyltransferase